MHYTIVNREDPKRLHNFLLTYRCRWINFLAFATACFRIMLPDQSEFHDCHLRPGDNLTSEPDRIDPITPGVS